MKEIIKTKRYDVYISKDFGNVISKQASNLTLMQARRKCKELKTKDSYKYIVGFVLNNKVVNKETIFCTEKTPRRFI